MTSEKPTTVVTPMTETIIVPMSRAVIDSSTSKDTILVPMNEAVVDSSTSKVPMNESVVDSSTSKDDTNAQGLKYECKTPDRPLIYVHGNLSRVSKLTLKDLITGNYTIRLMVEEAEGMYK